MCVFGESLYLYGGWNQYNFSSDLYRLDLSTYEWKMVALSNDVKPTPVYLTTMMVYEERIITFGGVGLRVTAEKLEESGAEYHHCSDTPHAWGWNNEYHEFSFKESMLSYSQQLCMQLCMQLRMHTCSIHVYYSLL